MRFTNLFLDALRLEIGVIDSLVELDCIHQYGSAAATVQLEVPPESAHFDPQTGLVWVEVHPDRLPRRQTFQSLIDRGLQEVVTSKFGFPVQVLEQDKNLVIVWQASDEHSEVALEDFNATLEHRDHEY